MEGLTVRFGPATFQNMHGELVKIQRTSTVSDYQVRFERLSNRPLGWSEHQLVGTFVEGLKSRKPIMMLNHIGHAQ